MAENDSDEKRARLKALRKRGAVAGGPGRRAGTAEDGDAAEGAGDRPVLRRILEARRQRGGGSGGEGEGGGGRFPGLRQRLREQRGGEGGGGGGGGGGGLDVTEESSAEELQAAKESIQTRVGRLEKGLERSRENLKKVEDWLAAKG